MIKVPTPKQLEEPLGLEGSSKVFSRFTDQEKEDSLFEIDPRELKR